MKTSGRGYYCCLFHRDNVASGGAFLASVLEKLDRETR